ncbi:MAG: hypothetical protein Q9183_007144 [Haloplaca sp. 2 TL-2023]
MSDLLREEAKRPDSPWALEINAKLPKGELMSGKVTTAVLDRYIREVLPFDGRLLLLDGFPRNLEQAKDFELLNGRAQKIISLTCSENVMKERLAARGRNDDAQEIAESRYQSYLEETVPAIEYLKRGEHEVVEVSDASDLRGRTLPNADGSQVSSDQSGDEGFYEFVQAI